MHSGSRSIVNPGQQFSQAPTENLTITAVACDIVAIAKKPRQLPFLFLVQKHGCYFVIDICFELSLQYIA